MNRLFPPSIVRLIGTIGLIWLTGLSTALAEDYQDYSLWVVEYENDIFAGEDRYYTSGVRLTRIAEARTIPDWLESIARRFPGFDDAEALPYSLAIGHNIYTPADIVDPAFPPDDRPYAGWLHLKFSTGTIQARGANRVRVGLGIVGPAALGKQIQKGVHRAINTDMPVGWDTQLKNEPTLLLGYDRFRRILEWQAPHYFGADLSVLNGVTVGNAYTHLSSGGFIRFGRNLPNDMGPPRITPAASGSRYFRPSDQRSWYVYFGTEGRLVGRDLFIEGNTIGGRDGVTARRAVGELFGGVIYTQGRFRAAYTHVWRNREFEGQLEAQDYGALSVSLWW
jgi:lipid A 3-O-deacylase